MHVLITTELSEPTPHVRGMAILRHRVTQTKTVLTLQYDRTTRAKLDLLHSAVSDLSLIGADHIPVTLFTVTVEGINQIGRLINRSQKCFIRIGFTLQTRMDYPAKSGVFTLTPSLPVYGRDVPYTLETLRRFLNRAMGRVNPTHRPYQLYDLKKAMGVPHDVTLGNPDAERLEEWLYVRQIAIPPLPHHRTTYWRREKRAEAARRKEKGLPEEEKVKRPPMAHLE